MELTGWSSGVVLCEFFYFKFFLNVVQVYLSPISPHHPLPHQPSPSHPPPNKILSILGFVHVFFKHVL